MCTLQEISVVGRRESGHGLNRMNTTSEAEKTEVLYAVPEDPEFSHRLHNLWSLIQFHRHVEGCHSSLSHCLFDCWRPLASWAGCSGYRQFSPITNAQTPGEIYGSLLIYWLFAGLCFMCVLKYLVLFRGVLYLATSISYPDHSLLVYHLMYLPHLMNSISRPAPIAFTVHNINLDLAHS